MSRCKAVWILVGASLLALLLAACDEGENTPTVTPASTPATAGPSSSAIPSSPGAATSPSPGVGAQTVTVDLASTAPLLTIFAGAPFPPPTDQPTGDLRNDIPSLATGDFNDDGIDDLLVGGRFADGPDDSRLDAGEAYVIFGSRDLGGSIDLARSQQDVIIYGAKPQDQLGYGVLAADINGDGVDDIVVSAPFSEGPEIDYRTDRGEVYVVFGRKDLPKVIDIALGQQDFTVVAAEGFSLLGDFMAGGDINGDGITDLVLGAPFAGRVPGSPHGGPRTELGETYVVLGSRDLSDSVSIPQDQEAVRISGPEQWSELGDAVAAGDVNGDGFDDVIAVAEAGDWPDNDRPNVGIAYIVFGSDGLSKLVDLAKGEQDVTIIGAGADDALGFCVSSGDLNGDKRDDVLLVAQRADGTPDRITSGVAYVVLGSSGLGGTIDALRGDQDATVIGPYAGALLSSCSAGPDVNGDGVGDVLLGTSFAHGPDPSEDLAGAAYIIFGPLQPGATMDLASGGANVVYYGAKAGDRLGSAVRAADLNGDGRPEIILVADEVAGPDGSRPGGGAIYVLGAIAQAR